MGSDTDTSESEQTVTCQFGHESTLDELKKEGQDYYCPTCYADVTLKVAEIRYRDTDS